MIAIALASGAALILGFLIGAKMGIAAGERQLWQRMLQDPQLGRPALEKLAEHHGAKLEMTELP